MDSKTVVIQTIPINQIKPNANNPRHVITEEMVNSMAASLNSAGLKNPIKLRLIQDTTYEVISGHIRLEGAKKLGWEAIPALILELTPNEALLEAILDNRGQEMTWLDLYQSIEILLKSDPNMGQKRVADLLEVDQTTVSRASILMACLNSASRTLLYEQFVKPEADQVTQRAIFALTSLKDPQIVEKALKLLLERQMTEAEAKELVESLKQGKGPESYGEKAGDTAASHQQPGIATAQNAPTLREPQGPEQSRGVGAGPRKDSGLDSADPFETYWAGLPKAMKVSQAKKGYRLVVNLTPKEAVPVVYGVKARLEELKASKEGGFKTEVASSPTPAYPMGAPGINDGNLMTQEKPGPLGILKKALGEKLKINPADIEDNLAKDAKQAVNYQIRRGMRKILKDLF